MVAGLWSKAPRIVAGVLVAGLTGVIAVFVFFESPNPSQDWVVLSNPFEMCGFAFPPVPREAPCLVRAYWGLSWRVVVAVAAVGLPIWAALRAGRRASLRNLVLAWAAAGFLAETAYLLVDPFGISLEPKLIAEYPVAFLIGLARAERLAVFAGMVSAMMAVVFWAVAKARQPRPGQGAAAAA